MAARDKISSSRPSSRPSTINIPGPGPGSGSGPGLGLSHGQPTTVGTVLSHSTASDTRKGVDRSSGSLVEQAASDSSSPSCTTASQHRQHQVTPSTSSFSIRSPRSGGFFALASAAIDRTIATISPEPQLIRHRLSPSTSSLNRLSPSLESPTSGSEQSFRHTSSAATTPTIHSPLFYESKRASESQEELISRPYSETDATRPPPIRMSGSTNKMHQTSSRLLRMTDNERPFTRVSHASFHQLWVTAGRVGRRLTPHNRTFKICSQH